MKIRNIDISRDHIESNDTIDIYDEIKITWVDKKEFGEIKIRVYYNGTVKIDSEYMDKKFIKQILYHIIDDAELIN